MAKEEVVRGGCRRLTDSGRDRVTCVHARRWRSRNGDKAVGGNANTAELRESEGNVPRRGWLLWTRDCIFLFFCAPAFFPFLLRLLARVWEWEVICLSRRSRDYMCNVHV